MKEKQMDIEDHFFRPSSSRRELQIAVRSVGEGQQSRRCDAVFRTGCSSAHPRLLPAGRKWPFLFEWQLHSLLIFFIRLFRPHSGEQAGWCFCPRKLSLNFMMVHFVGETQPGGGGVSVPTSAVYRLTRSRPRFDPSSRRWENTHTHTHTKKQKTKRSRRRRRRRGEEEEEEEEEEENQWNLNLGQTPVWILLALCRSAVGETELSETEYSCLERT